MVKSSKKTGASRHTNISSDITSITVTGSDTEVSKPAPQKRFKKVAKNESPQQILGNIIDDIKLGKKTKSKLVTFINRNEIDEDNLQLYLEIISELQNDHDVTKLMKDKNPRLSSTYVEYENNISDWLKVLNEKHIIDGGLCKACGKNAVIAENKMMSALDEQAKTTRICVECGVSN